MPFCVTGNGYSLCHDKITTSVSGEKGIASVMINNPLVQWTEYFPGFNNADILLWHRICKLSFSVTRKTGLQTFQYLLVHRVISCNKWLCNQESVTFVMMLMIWYTSLYTVKILSNYGPVSINGGTIYLNLILEQMIFLRNVHYLVIQVKKTLSKS